MNRSDEQYVSEFRGSLDGYEVLSYSQRQRLGKQLKESLPADYVTVEDCNGDFVVNVEPKQPREKLEKHIGAFVANRETHFKRCATIETDR